MKFTRTLMLCALTIGSCLGLSAQTSSDMTPPAAVCQDVTVQLDQNGSYVLPGSEIDGGSSDNVAIASLGTCLVGCKTVDWTKDDQGNPLPAGTNLTTQLAGLGIASVSANGGINQAWIFDSSNPTGGDDDLGTPSQQFGGPGVGSGGNTNTTALGNILIIQENNSGIPDDNAGGGDIVFTFTQPTFVNAISVVDIEGNGTYIQAGGVTYPVPPTGDNGVSVVPLNAGPITSLTVHLSTSGGISGFDLCQSAPGTTCTNVLTCANLGPANQAALIVSDAAGNNSYCISNVTVEDNIAPEALCLDITAQLDANGEVTVTSADIDGGSTDNCSVTVAAPSTTFDCSNLGSNHITLTATDGSGNTDNCTATIAVEDNVAPNALCQDLTVFLNGSGLAFVNVNDIDAGSNDACGIATVTTDAFVYACGNIGANTATLTVTDVNGNVSTCTSQVTVEDTLAPTAVCQDFTVSLDANGNASVTPFNLIASVSDNCGSVTCACDSLSQTSFDCDDIGTVSVIVIATDVNGNAATCTSQVTVEDNIAPVAVCQDITVQLDANGNANVSASDIDGGSTDNCAIILIGDVTLDCSNLGSNSVTLTVADSSGNSDNCTANVTVEDNTAPTAICKNINVNLDANGSVTIVAEDVDGGSFDNCTNVTLSVSQTTFSCADLGNNFVTLTVTDANGNSSTCQARVRVRDRIAPVAICQNVTVQLDTAGVATIAVSDIDNGSYDNCSVTLSVDNNAFSCTDVNSAIAGDLFISEYVEAVGQERYLEIFNGTGAPVNLADYEVRRYPGGNTNANNNNRWALSGTLANGTALVLRNDLATGPGQAVTNNTMKFSGDDAMAIYNVATASFIDIFGVIGEDPGGFWLANTGERTSNRSLRRLNTVLNGVTINPALGNGNAGFSTLGSQWNAHARGNLADLGRHGISTNSNTVVTLTATDGSNNTDSCTAVITVEDNIAPNAVCENITVTLDQNGTYTLSSGDIDGGSGDNCCLSGIQACIVNCNTIDFNTCGAGVTLTPGIPLTTEFTALGISSITAVGGINEAWLFDSNNPTGGDTDLGTPNQQYGGPGVGNGGASNDVGLGFVVIIQENAGVPDDNAGGGDLVFTFTGPTDVNEITLLDIEGNGSYIQAGSNQVAIPAAGDNGVSTVNVNAQGLTSLTVHLSTSGGIAAMNICPANTNDCDTVFTCDDLGVNNVVLTVTDHNGNTDQCIAEVTVTDSIAPTAICEGITVQLDSNGQAVIVASDIDGGSSDNCSIDTITVSQTDFDCSDVGVVNVTLTVIDGAGNVSTCTADVNVEDNIAPVAICQNITVELDQNGSYTLGASEVDGGSYDNCAVSLEACIRPCGVVGFDNDDQNAPLAAGTQVTTQLAGLGIASVTANGGINQAWIFDSSNPTGGDGDLGTPNSQYGGPGTGSGGAANDAALGNLLIIQENNSGNPDDNAGGGDLVFTFTGATEVNAVTILDNENNGSYIQAGSNQIAIPTTGDNGLVTVPVNATGLTSLTIHLSGSGAVANLDICTSNGGSCDTSFTCADVGDNEVILTVTDPSGNTDSCTAIVTIDEGSSVTIACPGDITTTCETGDGGAWVTWTEPTAEATSTCSNGCPSDTHLAGFIYMGEFNGHRYYCSDNDNFSWDAANSAAMAAGGNLVTINNNAENQWLKSQIMAPYVWIGYNDVAVEGTFEWSSGENSSYTNWQAGEPNNAGGSCCGTGNLSNADYAALQRNNGRWYDRRGCLEYEFVMEVPCASAGVTVTQISGPGNGDLFPEGTTTVTYVASDNNGNTDTCSFDVTVEELFEILCPGDIVVPCNNNQGGAVVCWNDPNVIYETCDTSGCASDPHIAGFVYMGEHDGHRYYCSNGDNFDWNQANAAAMAAGGDLVTINNSAENQWLRNKIQASYVWIGYNDVATEGQFEWSSGEANSYTYWKSGEPNNQGGSCCGVGNLNNADYAVLRKNNGRWYDRKGCNNYEFVMEIPCAGYTLEQIAGPANGSIFNEGTTTITYLATTANGNTTTCSFDVTVEECTPVYCHAKASCSGYEWIESVTYGGVSNNSGNDGGYGDYTNITNTVVAGGTMNLSMTPGFSGQTYNEYWKVWVDWNRDGDFYDAGELVFADNGSGNVNGDVQVPTQTSSGALRMRVAMRWNCYAAGPCCGFNYGEIEDYTLYVAASSARTAGGAAGSSPSGIDMNDVMQEVAAPSVDPSGFEFSMVHPNPVLRANQGTVTIDYRSGRDETINIRVTDLYGKVFFATVVDAKRGVNQTELNVSDLSAGAYLIEVTTDGDKKTEKLIVQ